MTATLESARAFAVWFKDLDRWDYLSLWLRKGFRVKTALERIGEVCAVRKCVVSPNDVESGKVHMVDRVSFDGELFAGEKQQTRMTQFLALPGDIVVSKIRARQGSIGLVTDQHGPVSVTIHYRVLTPHSSRLDKAYAWLAMRSSYVRAQFLAATGGAMKGEISEEALLDIQLPLPLPRIQQAIVEHWQKAQSAVSSALDAFRKQSGALDGYLRQRADMTAFGRPWLSVPWREIMSWDMKAARAALFRLRNPTFQPLGTFAEEATELVKPWEQPDKDWPVYGVNNKEGVFFSHHQMGRDFNAPYKRIRKDWFFHNPTRSNVGSLGIVPDVPEDAITSPEYQVWRVRSDMSAGFVAVLIRTPFFVELIQVHRVGAVKQRLYVENLLQIPIPVVPDEKRKEFAQERERLLATLENARKKAETAKAEVEEMILGVRPVR